jgi:hypothetical protein
MFFKCDPSVVSLEFLILYRYKTFSNFRFLCSECFSCLICEGSLSHSSNLNTRLILLKSGECAFTNNHNLSHQLLWDVTLCH